MKLLRHKILNNLQNVTEITNWELRIELKGNLIIEFTALTFVPCYYLPRQIEYAHTEEYIMYGESRLNQAEGKNEGKKYREWEEGTIAAYLRKYQQKYT